MQTEIDRNLAEGGVDSRKQKEIKEMDKKLQKTVSDTEKMEKE